MSAIFGLLNFDGAPASAQTLDCMAAALAFRGPHGRGLWQSGPAGLGHFLLASTPEAAAERQPLAHAASGIALAADARLDNRADLLAALAGQVVPSGAGGVIADADLILAAYLRWGEACPAQLVGDFAFAVIAPAERRVFLARDPVGMRQLVYYHDDRRLLFATSLEALLAALPPQPVNRPLLLDFAAGVFDRIPAETPYRTIRRLPPAHSLALAPDTARLQRYFTFGLDESARRLSAAEHVERLAELLAQAVGSCLRSPAPVAIAGAGGLDSGGVMALAQRAIAAGRAGAPVNVYAAVFPATPAAGEDEYLQAIETACPDLCFNRIDAEGDWYMKPVPPPEVHPMPDLDTLAPEWAMLYHLLQAARADGCLAFLNGSYGDGVFGEWVYDNLDCLADLPLADWRREAPYFLRRLRRPIPALVSAAAAFVPPGARRRLRRLLGWRGPAPGLPPPEQPALAPDPVFTPMPEPPGLSFAGRRMHQRLFNGQAAARQLASDQLGGRLGLEVRRPYLDRRLLDFALQLRSGDLAEAGLTRRLYRQALAGVLPEPVRLRVDKVSFDHLVRRGLLQQEKERIQAMLADLQAARLGLVDAAALQAAFAAYWNGAMLTYRRVLWPLALEIWLQRNPQAANPLTASSHLDHFEV